MKRSSPEPALTSAAFLAYELASAVGFIAFFTPYALFKMAGTPAYRAGIGQRLSLYGWGSETGSESRPIWIQAVSMGEVKSVAPLVHKINERGDPPVFLTSTTETGFRVAGELLGESNAISYFPLDFSPIVSRVLRRVKPRAIVLFETEIWPNFIRTASSLNIPVCIINGRISEKSFRYYKLFPVIFSSIFSRISFAGMQSGRDAEKAVALGAGLDVVEVCGNVKFDAAPPLPVPEEVETMRLGLGLEKGTPLIVAGSTHEGEEAILLEVYQRLLVKLPNVRLLLAPRHPERFNSVETLIRDRGLGVCRRSDSAGVQSHGSNAVILLDTIGELSHIYALASVSFVGGSLAKIGGHNIIEPASFGKPVVFGPHMYHFEDVKEIFLSEGAAISVNDENELFDTISRLLKDSSTAEKLGRAAEGVVEANRGATDRYFDAIEKYF